MQGKDLLAPGGVRRVDRHPPVEATGPQQGWVENLRRLVAAMNDLTAVEPVHLRHCRRTRPSPPRPCWLAAGSLDADQAWAAAGRPRAKADNPAGAPAEDGARATDAGSPADSA